MRTEQQVLDQLLSFAKQREDIRVVTMNGSRVNPNAPNDIFQDYDVVYFVKDPHKYLCDQRWIAEFGELVILQQNNFEEHGQEGYIFLMLFQDGVRIDLSFDPLPNLAYIGEDTLTRVLLDKDGLAPALPPPSDAGYYPPKPTRRQFGEAVNEVFWCANNVAKGIWRDELTYARYMLDEFIRGALLKLLDWYAASRHDWGVTSGYGGKWLKKLLPADIWEMVVETYAGPSYDSVWDAVFAACRLARRIGKELADQLGYSYPLEDDERVLDYLRRARALPSDAKSFD